MAMTATITVTPSPAVTSIDCTGILVISNSASTSVRVLSIQPTVLPTGATNATYNTGIALQPIPFGPNSNTTVPASSSLTVTFPITFHAPSTGTLSTGANTYSVGATVYTDDNSVFAPTPATLTVNYVTSFNASQS